MAKLPFMKFYPGDWIGATRALTAERRGAYIVLVCHLWINAPKGEMTFLWDDLAALWQCDITQASLIVTSLKLNNCIEAAEIILESGHKAIKITQRRIKRDKKEYENHAFRQKRYREKTRQFSDASSDGKVTPKKSEVRSHINTPIVPKRDERFESFWKAYPKKVGKGAAEKSWQKLNPAIEQVLQAIANQLRSDQWKRDAGQFIPHPATWLNQRRWEDEPMARYPSTPFEHRSKPIKPPKEEDRLTPEAMGQLKDHLKQVGNVSGNPLWPAPYAAPEPKSQPDQPWIPPTPKIESQAL